MRGPPVRAQDSAETPKVGISPVGVEASPAWRRFHTNTDNHDIAWGRGCEHPQPSDPGTPWGGGLVKIDIDLFRSDCPGQYRLSQLGERGGAKGARKVGSAEGWGLKGAKREGGKKGGGPKISRFSLSLLALSLFFFSLGVFSWNFGGV